MPRRTPPIERFRHAREGTIGVTGRLPAAWLAEGIDQLSIDTIDLGPRGPAITLSIAFGAGSAQDAATLSLGDFVAAQRGDVAALRFEAGFAGLDNVASVQAIVREFVTGGDVAGQAMRPVPLADDDDATATVCAHATSGDRPLLRPFLTLRRAEPGAARATIRLARIAFGSLYAFPDWLSVTPPRG